MNKNWSLGVTIGATMDGGFKSVVGGAREQFNSLGSSIRQLSGQRGLIERLEKDRAELEKSRLKLGATQKDVLQLKLALRKDPGNKGLAADLEKLQGKAVRLGQSLEKQRVQVSRSEAAMHKAGLEVKDHAREYVRLGEAIDRTRAKQVRMQTVMARRDAAGQRLSDQRGSMLGLAGAAYGASQVIGQSMESEYEMRMFGNVADLSNEKLGEIRLQLRGISTDTNQKPGALIEALNTLTAKGLDPDRAVASLGIIGKTATASGADINDLAATAFTLIDAMGLSPDELPKAMDMLAQAGKAGSFELKDMAQYFPMLTAQAKSLHMVGTEGIATLGAALQIAMKGAADPAAAANNFQNFLAKLTNPETVKKFETMGVDIESAMKQAMGAGKNPIEEMVLLIDQLTGGDKFRIGELFGDMQVINFLNPMLQNLEEFKKIKAEALTASGVVAKDFGNIATTSKFQLEAFTIAVGKIGDTFAVVLMPAVNAVLQPLTAVAGWVGNLIETFPVIGSVITGAVVGLVALQGAMMIGTAAVWLFNAALLANPITWVVLAIGAAVGAIVHYWDPISGFFKGLWGGIKEIFMDGVGFLTKVWELSPIGLMFKAGSAISGWVGSAFEGTKTAATGAAVGVALATNVAAMPTATLPQTGQSTTISAPIQINAAPGMNAEDVANAVDKKLREREAMGQAKMRGALHD